MPAPYPMPQNITDIATFGDYINVVTGGFFGIAILLVTTIVFFSILSLRYSIRMATGATGTIMGLMAIIWRFAGMINDFVMFTFVIAGFGSLIYLYFTKED
jgi:hypothetical protein